MASASTFTCGAADSTASRARCPTPRYLASAARCRTSSSDALSPRPGRRRDERPQRPEPACGRSWCQSSCMPAQLALSDANLAQVVAQAAFGCRMVLALKHIARMVEVCPACCGSSCPISPALSADWQPRSVGQMDAVPLPIQPRAWGLNLRPAGGWRRRARFPRRCRTEGSASGSPRPAGRRSPAHSSPPGSRAAAAPHHSRR